MTFCTAHSQPGRPDFQPAPLPNAHRRERRRPAPQTVPQPTPAHVFTDWASI